MTSLKNWKIIVTVIAYNEEQNIGGVLQDLVDHNFGYDIVVIDNGSYDRTAEISRSMGIPVVSHCINTGSQFGTINTVFMYAYDNDYDILCQFDGDGQHRASEIIKNVEVLKRGEADFVIGSRFLEKKGFQSYFIRRIGIKFFSWLDSRIIGHKMTDITSGFQAYNRKIINFFSQYFRHEISDTNQFLLISHFAGAKIKEVPIIMDERKHGRSEFGLFESIGFIGKSFINIIGCLLQRHQIKEYIGEKDGTAN